MLDTRVIVPWHDGLVNRGAAAPAWLGDRFELIRQLGEGGFGTVHEAVDKRYGGSVALKVLRRDHANAIYRFKREFRSLAEVTHPNLVQLYELFGSDEALYFTMELVDGIDLRSYVCGAVASSAHTVTLDVVGKPVPQLAQPRATDAIRLRAAFGQLAIGVEALHAAQKLHCDIKPSNVLVTGSGRVVLLDFGLIADLDGRADNRGIAVGTAGYLAPEQALGEPLTEAADWYSVGVMLYEALQGTLPAPDTRCESAAADLVDLATLATDLLLRDSSRRPAGNEVIRRLGGGDPPARRMTRVQLFGRDDERRAMRASWDAARKSGPIFLRVKGASGMGKTALVDDFLAELSDEIVVLRGRCYEQESVPYKALDTVVDALANYLRALGPEAAPLVPPDVALLGRLFPVFRDAAPTVPSAEVDSQELRRRAFGVLRELLQRICEGRDVVCVLDDLQWGDVDSARLLGELLRPPDAPRLLVIGSYRTGVASRFLEVFDEQARGIADPEIIVGSLSAEAGRELADHLLPTASILAATISTEAAGSPLFIQLAARAREKAPHGPERNLAELIVARVNSLEGTARSLIETIALAGQPIAEAIALRAATLDGAGARTAALAVRHARLVTAQTAGELVVLETVHDRVRETLIANLSPERLRAGHRNIAEALLALDPSDPDRLVNHFRGAGDDVRTREFALVAVERADAALAFDRAAAHLALILELTPASEPARWTLHERHGVALANAGRAADAAESYEEAATSLVPTGQTALVLRHRRRAGELTLQSGRVELGTRRLSHVLHSVGVRMPRSRRSAFALAIFRRLRLLIRGIDAPMNDAAGPPAALDRLDALWSTITGLGMLDQVVADSLALQFLHEALDLGARDYLVRGLGLEAMTESVIGGRFLDRSNAKLIARMDALVTERGRPYDRAWTHLARGITGWFHGSWRASRRACDDAIATYRDECRGVAWELALCEAYRLPAIAYLGDLNELCAIVPRAYESASARGDLYAANTLLLGQQSLVRLVEDQPADAIQTANTGVEPFPRETYLGPHYHHLFAVAQAEIYRGNPAVAWAGITSAWKAIDGAHFLDAQMLRVEIRQLRARAALAMATSDRSQSARLLRTALGDAKRMAKDTVPPAAPMAAAIRAGVAAFRGDADSARRELTAALTGFEAADMALHAHAVADRLGALTGGDEGKALRTRTASWMEAQHVRRPEALIAMLVPGV